MGRMWCWVGCLVFPACFASAFQVAALTSSVFVSLSFSLLPFRDGSAGCPSTGVHCILGATCSSGFTEDVSAFRRRQAICRRRWGGCERSFAQSAGTRCNFFTSCHWSVCFYVRPPTQDSLLVLSNVNRILRRIFFLHRNKIHLYRTPRLLHGLCVGTRCAVPFTTWLLVPLQAIARYLDII